MKFDDFLESYMAYKKASEQKGKKRKSAQSKSKLSLLNFKVSEEDHAKLVELANKYCEGNLSAWLRRAGLRYKPA